jgi:hypothetical protein
MNPLLLCDFSEIIGGGAHIQSPLSFLGMPVVLDPSMPKNTVRMVSTTDYVDIVNIGPDDASDPAS